MQQEVKITKAEVEMVQNAMAYGKVAPPPDLEAPAPVALKKAADVLKAKKPEEPKAPELVKPPEPVVEPPKVAEPAKPDAPKAPEPVKPDAPVIITQAVIDETAKELDSLKAALGTKYTADMDDKIGKIMESKNYENLIKGGFTAKQAVTQMALMAQGFVDVDKETQALITRKVEEVKTAAQLTPGGAAPTEPAATETDLIKAWGKDNYSLNSKAVGKMLNVDADAAAVIKAFGG